MQNVRLDEAQVGIKIAGRNINNLRYADDSTLRAENEEELKSLLMRVKEESENAGLTFKKTKYPVPSLYGKYKRGGNRSSDFIFLGSKITADGDCSDETEILFSLEGKL